MILSRVGLFVSAVALTGLMGLTLAAHAQTSASPQVNVQELMQPGALPDMAQGPENAKVTIIEYASLTCSHCATFHRDTYPKLKERYIDTGKVRYILRDFPLDPLATAGFMLARCEGGKNYYPLVDLLFAKQRDWAFVDRPVDALEATVRQAGITRDKFESCLKDQTLLDGVQAIKKRGEDAFKVSSTPTFFINGQVQRGAMSFEELEKQIKPILGE